MIPTRSQNTSFSLRERLHILSILGKSATSSKLIPGLLVEVPATGSKEGVSGVSISARRNKDGLIVTALFDVSMAGDLAEGIHV